MHITAHLAEQSFQAIAQELATFKLALIKKVHKKLIKNQQ